jgi:hypothetical protein
MTAIKLTPYDMETVHRALRAWRTNEQVVLTSNEDTLAQIESLAKRFASCAEVVVSTSD